MSLAIHNLKYSTQHIVGIRGFYRDPGFTQECYFVGHGETAREYASVHVDSSDDLSPLFVGLQSPTACGWCYLNALHSQRSHDSRVERASADEWTQGGGL